MPRLKIVEELRQFREFKRAKISSRVADILRDPNPNPLGVSGRMNRTGLIEELFKTS